MVVNDNERSYSPTIGGLATHLATLRTARSYERVLDWGKRVARSHPRGRPADLRDAARGQEGHQGRRRAAGDVRGPRAEVHRPGRRPRHRRARARARPRQGLPGPGASCTSSPRRVAATARPSSTTPSASTRWASSTRRPASRWPPRASRGPSVFADELVEIGSRRPDVVAITAAMMGPTGLDRFAREFPDRTYDVGIAEQHAATSAAGMAYAGLHPVVARLRDLRQPCLRPGAHGHRAAPGGRHLRARPRGHHRRRRRQPQRHVGHVDALRSSRACASPRRATRRRCARSSARRSTSTTHPPSCASRRAPSGRTCPALERIGGVDVLRRDADAERAAGLGRLLRAAVPRGGRPARGAGDGGHRRRPPLGDPGARRRWSTSRASTSSS